MALFTDAVTSAIERGLDGLSARSKVTANNIANVATPGFRSSRVNFEADLADALERGRPETAGVSTTAANTPARPDGNDVALEEETTILVRSGLHYDALVTALNYKFGLIRTAIGNR